MRPAIKVGLSTASVYPLRTEAAFEYAAKLGYDGVELMVWAETVSQDIDAIEQMSKRGLTVTKATGPEWRGQLDSLAKSMRGDSVPPDIFDLAIKARDEYRKNNAPGKK